MCVCACACVCLCLSPVLSGPAIQEYIHGVDSSRLNVSLDITHKAAPERGSEREEWMDERMGWWRCDLMPAINICLLNDSMGLTGDRIWVAQLLPCLLCAEATPTASSPPSCTPSIPAVPSMLTAFPALLSREMVDSSLQKGYQSSVSFLKPVARALTPPTLPPLLNPLLFSTFSPGSSPPFTSL